MYAFKYELKMVPLINSHLLYHDVDSAVYYIFIKLLKSPLK